MVTDQNFQDIHFTALDAAKTAADKFYQEKLNGQDMYACGFAWVTVFGVKGNTKLGKVMKNLGFSKSWEGGLQLWNPSGHFCQNIDTKEEGARAYAKILTDAGLQAYPGSRLD